MNRNSGIGYGAFFIKLSCYSCGRVSKPRASVYYGYPQQYRVPNCPQCKIQYEAIFVSKNSFKNLFK